MDPLRVLNTSGTCSYSLLEERFGDFHRHSFVVKLSNLKSRKPWPLPLGLPCMRPVRPKEAGVPREVWARWETPRDYSLGVHFGGVNVVVVSAVAAAVERSSGCPH